MRIALHEETVLVGARFRLVAVDHEVARPHALRGEAPFYASREPSTAAAEHGRVADFVVHLLRAHL